VQISIECELPCSSVWWDYLSYIRLISWIPVVAMLNILCFIPARESSVPFDVEEKHNAAPEHRMICASTGNKDLRD